MASTPEALVEIDLEGKLKKLASGKVRDVFIVDEKTLLFVASDRISAYDVIMKNVSTVFVVLFDFFSSQSMLFSTLSFQLPDSS